MIAITPGERALVLDILKRYVPDCEVRAFGSRCKGRSWEYSDLDLAVCGKEKLPNAVLDDLHWDFMESDLPFRVDIMDYHALSPAFATIVDRDGIVITAPGTEKRR
jgi:predicted nucleotidyltransferase